MKIVFASNNKNKFREIKELIGSGLELLNLNDIGCYEEIPEPFSTIEENALAKARYVYKNYGLDSFADDTALEAESLGGRPGVYSARYASLFSGKEFSSAENRNEANIIKLLEELQGAANRRARFRTVIYLILRGREIMFEGIVNGTITEEKRGHKGFGYDPVFIPDGYNKTFAQMSLAEKNIISHRAKAFNKLAQYLRKQEH